MQQQKQTQKQQLQHTKTRNRWGRERRPKKLQEGFYVWHRIKCSTQILKHHTTLSSCSHDTINNLLWALINGDLLKSAQQHYGVRRQPQKNNKEQQSILKIADAKPTTVKWTCLNHLSSGLHSPRYSRKRADKVAPIGRLQAYLYLDLYCRSYNTKQNLNPCSLTHEKKRQLTDNLHANSWEPRSNLFAAVRNNKLLNGKHCAGQGLC